jgi:hypothetical protein
MDAAAFYQTLSSTSFTLLGIWFGVMQFSHGGWWSDPQRHRSTVHIALHFFLPGMVGLGALLSTPTDGGIMWRTVFVIGGLIGLAESVSFLGAPGASLTAAGRTLRLLDPVWYALMILAALLPAGLFVLAPLQIEGIATGLLFLSGLCSVWLAFAEPARAAH